VNAFNINIFYCYTPRAESGGSGGELLGDDVVRRQRVRVVVKRGIYVERITTRIKLNRVWARDGFSFMAMRRARASCLDIRPSFRRNGGRCVRADGKVLRARLRIHVIYIHGLTRSIEIDRAIGKFYRTRKMPYLWERGHNFPPDFLPPPLRCKRRDVSVR
jgi:hypothetical protein